MTRRRRLCQMPWRRRAPRPPMGLAVVSAMMETTPPAKIDYAMLAGRKKKKKGDDKEGGPR